uniref:Secreted protein n=1 Tax=Arundo donax TaxID=35708 RepID=A0A0A9A8W2_ARUDO
MISPILGLLCLLDSTHFSAISMHVFTWLQYASKYDTSFHPAICRIFLHFPCTRPTKSWEADISEYSE